MIEKELNRLISRLENGSYDYKHRGKQMSEDEQYAYAQYIKDEYYDELLSDDFDTAEKVLCQIDDAYDSGDVSWMYPNGMDDE